jgi:hypothetical protein
MTETVPLPFWLGPRGVIRSATQSDCRRAGRMLPMARSMKLGGGLVGHEYHEWKRCRSKRVSSRQVRGC